MEEREALVVHVIDLLTDQQVLCALKKALFPVKLSGRIDALNATWKARKERILEKVLIQENCTKLTLNFYISVLHILNP